MYCSHPITIKNVYVLAGDGMGTIYLITKVSDLVPKL